MAKEGAGSSAISEESLALLEGAKKGKRRKFVLVSKGADVVSLVVYKKGDVEKHKKEAKQGGAGQVCFGVIDGQGLDLRFLLARADGFDKAPVKTASLKSFLEDTAGVKCKPLFEIVDAAPLVLDDEDPLVARFLRLSDAAVSACEAHPDRATAINTLCRQIGEQFDQGRGDATSRLDELERLLGGLGSSSPPVPPTAPPPPPAPPTASTGDDDARARKLVESLQKLKTAADDVAKAQPERKDELTRLVAQIAGEIKTRQLDAAQATMLSLGKALQRPAVSIEPGIVKKRTFMLTRLQALPVEIRPHLDALKNQIREREPQEDAELLASAIEAALDVLFEEIRDMVDDSITAGDSGRLQGLKDRVLQHELVAHLVKNPYTDGTPFQAVVLEALEEIERALAG